MKTLGLYLHVPFCVQKCNYCDFLSAPATDEVIRQYADRLIEEITHAGENYKDYQVDTIFFGGGTPSIVPIDKMEGIMDAVRKAFQIADTAEITMECNPGTVDIKSLMAYRKMGINRISFGLQSSDDKDLKRLGRIHTFPMFLQSFEEAREAGFFNINIDLMTALPGQNWECFVSVLENVIKLEPEHISVYSLIVEEGTPFYRWYEEEQRKDLPPLPDEEEDRKIYHETLRFLRKYGYDRYEISNYAKKGYECKHNMKYWERSDYLGLGLGASSMINNERWHQTSDRNKYMREDFCREDLEKLTLEECMSEYMFLGLRMMKGVSKEVFLQNFGKDMETVYGDILHKHIQNRLLIEEKGWVRLTEKGIDVSNYVMSDFI